MPNPPTSSAGDATGHVAWEAGVLTLGDVARELRRARREARLSQEDLANKARVTRSTVSRMETTAKADMSLRVVLRLFEAAGYELRPVRQIPGDSDAVPGAQSEGKDLRGD